MSFPLIDEHVKTMGMGKLRGIANSELRDALREDIFIVQGPRDENIAVLISYDKFLILQESAKK